LEIHVSRTRGITSPTIRRELQGRNEIEPVIGRMKQDGFWSKIHPRSWRETFNVMLCAIGHHLRLPISAARSRVACQSGFTQATR